MTALKVAIMLMVLGCLAATIVDDSPMRLGWLFLGGFYTLLARA